MNAAKPDIKAAKKLSAIWIIPLVAALLGIWMVVYTYMNEGPEIEVNFASAVGLEAGKTRVKFLNVDVGLVQDISLNPDLKGVTARIKLERSAIPLLGDDTRFWVVTARVGGGTVEGLDTLLSGAYIAISPASSRSAAREFVALERPPLTPVGAHGLRLVLVSERSPSVGAGDPVLFNGFKVGRVEEQSFDPDTRQQRYTIFVDAPYHQLVDTSVRFWDVSGFRVDLDTEGLQLETGSLETILLGGVTFGHVPWAEKGESVTDNTVFRLFRSFDEIQDSPYENRIYFVAEFTQSLKGLHEGAPVEYRGIEIGSVERILIADLVDMIRSNDRIAHGDPIPVLFYVEPGRIGLPDTLDSAEKMREIVTTSAEKGARVSLQTSNLLTGAQSLSLEFYEDVPAEELREFNGYTVLPSIATGLGELQHKLSSLLDKVNGLPLETTVGSANRSLIALGDLLEADSTQAIPGELHHSAIALRELLQSEHLANTLAELDRSATALRNLLDHESMRQIPTELEGTLEAARLQLEGDSTETYQLVVTLQEVEAAARALREFLDLMETKPESLIRGKTNNEQ